MPADLTLDDEKITIEGMLVQMDNVLEIHTDKVPAAIRLLDKAGKAEVFISLGQIKLTRDVNLQQLATMSGTESLVRTLAWMIERLRALERKVGLPSPSRVAGEQRG